MGALTHFIRSCAFSAVALTIPYSPGEGPMIPGGLAHERGLHRFHRLFTKAICV